MLEGADVSGVPPHKRNVNTVFQQYALFPHLSVVDNVEFGLRAQVDHRSHTELADHRHIGRGEPIEAVGAEQAAPACGATIDGGIPADVAEVVHGIEPNQSPGVATDIGELAALHISTVPSAVARRPTAR